MPKTPSKPQQNHRFSRWPTASTFGPLDLTWPPCPLGVETRTPKSRCGTEPKIGKARTPKSPGTSRDRPLRVETNLSACSKTRCRPSPLNKNLKTLRYPASPAVNPRREAPKFKIKISVPTVNSVAKTSSRSAQGSPVEPRKAKSRRGKEQAVGTRLLNFHLSRHGCRNPDVAGSQRSGLSRRSRAAKVNSPHKLSQAPPIASAAFNAPPSMAGSLRDLMLEPAISTHLPLQAFAQSALPDCAKRPKFF